jgi:predicted acyltransferase
MTNQTAIPAQQPRRLWRSAGSVLLGFFAVVILSLATDQVLHVLKVYPPWGEPMRDPGLNLLALSYRIVYTVLGGYLAARFAPRNPMRHAFVLAVIGLVMGVMGVIATSGLDLGPRWYPIAIAVTALPCTWLGGLLHRAKHP